MPSTCCRASAVAYVAHEGGPGAAVGLGEGERVPATTGSSGFWREGLVEGEAVLEGEAVRLVDRLDVPVAVVLLALGAGHEVVHPAAGGELVVDEGGRIGRRTPHPLELARVGVHLPDAVGGRRELGSDGQRAGLEVVGDVGDGHGDQSFGVEVSGGCGEEVVHPGDAAAPERLQLGEHHAHRPHRLHVAAGQGLATLPTLGQQARSLQHGDVLLDGGEAHVVALRQRRDGVLAGQHSPQDVAPGPVGEGVEPGVRPGLVRLVHGTNLQPNGCRLSRPPALFPGS